MGKDIEETHRHFVDYTTILRLWSSKSHRASVQSLQCTCGCAKVLDSCVFVF